MLSLHLPLTLPMRKDRLTKTVHVTNQGITLQIQNDTGDFQFLLTRDSARDLASTLTSAAQTHATFEAILPYLTGESP